MVLVIQDQCVFVVDDGFLNNAQTEVSVAEVLVEDVLLLYLQALLQYGYRLREPTQ